MKKLFTLAVAAIAAIGMVGTASAAEYTVNMCGASAQAGFWEAAGAAVVQESFQCDSAVLDADNVDKESLIIKAENCNLGALGTGHTLYVRYKPVSSSFGCQNYDCVSSGNWAKASSCLFNGTLGTCTETENASCMLGCADVDCDSITATTVGYYNGRSGAVAGEAFMGYGSSAGFPITPDKNYGGVVVPFGFIANNAITDAVCTWDGLDANAHLSYDKRGWECDPDELGYHSCVGTYKCVDGACYDGNQGTADEKSCSTASDCEIRADGGVSCYDSDSDGVGVCMTEYVTAATGDDYDTVIDDGETQCAVDTDCIWNATDAADSNLITLGCEKKPLENVSRLMVLHIFGGQVDNWNDFGPSFEDMPIVQCMRHGGSGTHQTLINTVFRGDMDLATVSTVYVSALHGNADDNNTNYIWHYKSSSTLTKDCVDLYDGAIGYVDADKVMFRSGIDGPVHQLKYQGVAPSRLAVANGKYNFWSAQKCFSNSEATCYGTDTITVDGETLSAESYILDEIMTKAGDPTFLTYAGFGQRAMFWATQDEMQVKKLSETAYPSR